MIYLVGPVGTAVIKVCGHLDLTKPHIGILHICSGFPNRDHGFAIGMDLTRKTPMQLETRLYRDPMCAEKLKNDVIDIDVAGQIRYGSNNEKVLAGVCYGDFGGPLVIKNGLTSEVMFLIGNNLQLPSVFFDASLFVRNIQEMLHSSRPSRHLFHELTKR